MEEQYKRWEQGREELLHRRGAKDAKERGLPVACQVQTPLTYKGHRLRNVYQADLIVDHSLLVEVKSVDALAAIHQSQLLTYWKLNSLPLGLLLNFNVPLLLNFNVPLMKKGIKRLVDGLQSLRNFASFALCGEAVDVNKSGLLIGALIKSRESFPTPSWIHRPG